MGMERKHGIVTKEFWEDYTDEGRMRQPSASSSLFIDSVFKSAAFSHGPAELAHVPRLLTSSLSIPVLGKG